MQRSQRDAAAWHGPGGGMGPAAPMYKTGGRRGKQMGRNVGAEMSPLQAAPVILQDTSLPLASREEEGKDPEDMNSFLYQLTQACHCLPAYFG